eukprot:Pgem_evm1s11184
MFFLLFFITGIDEYPKTVKFPMLSSREMADFEAISNMEEHYLWIERQMRDIDLIVFDIEEYSLEFNIDHQDKIKEWVSLKEDFEEKKEELKKFRENNESEIEGNFLDKRKSIIRSLAKQKIDLMKAYGIKV